MIVGTYTFGSVDGGVNNAGWSLTYGPDKSIALGYGTGGGWNAICNTAPNSVPLNTTSRITIRRVGTALKVYINEVEVVSVTSTHNIAYAKSYAYIGSYARGDADSFSANISFAGYIDRLRLTKGVGREPSALPFPNTGP